MPIVIRLIIAMFFAVSFADTVSAEVFKCLGKDGKTGYQETPCAEGSTSSPLSVSKDSHPPARDLSGTAKTTHSPGSFSQEKYNNDTFRKYMAQGQFAKAAPFAASEKQKMEVEKALAKKQAKCRELLIKRDQAYADSKWKGGARQHAAEAAEARYRGECA